MAGQQHPIGIYLKIWGLLFVLSTASYLVDFFHIQGYLRWFLIITFMLMKAGLIVAVFMHMLWERMALMYAILIPPLLFEKPLPSHIIGILSLILLTIACFALYGMKLAGAWRWIYVLTSLVSLYLNLFVLVIQSFLKVPALHALAPSVPPAELPFAIVQASCWYSLSSRSSA